MTDCKAAGVDGFIIVDLPPEEAVKFRDLTAELALSYIPLINQKASRHCLFLYLRRLCIRSDWCSISSLY